MTALAGGEEVEGLRVEHTRARQPPPRLPRPRSAATPTSATWPGSGSRRASSRSRRPRRPRSTSRPGSSRSIGSRRSALQRLRLTHFGLAEDPAAQLERARESLRALRRARPRATIASAFLAAIEAEIDASADPSTAESLRQAAPPEQHLARTRALLAKARRSGSSLDRREAVKFGDRIHHAPPGCSGLSSGYAPTSTPDAQATNDKHGPWRRRSRSRRLAIAAGRRDRRGHRLRERLLEPAPSTARSSRSGGGKRCDRNYREKSKSMRRLGQDRGPTTCSFRPPVQGDRELPNHEARLDAQDPQGHRQVGSRRRLHRAHRSRRRRRRRLRAARLPEARALRAHCALPAARTSRSRARATRSRESTSATGCAWSATGAKIRALVNGKEVATVSDPDPGQVAGRKVRFAVGGQKDGAGKVVGTFKRVAVAVPDP